MTERFVKHATFVVERTYAAPPARVYRAWADPAAKAKWFSKADIFEFRVGGREYSSGGPPEGPVFTFDACYQEIVPEQRIVYSYTLIRATSESPFRSPRSSLSRSRAGRSWSSPSKGPFSMDTIRRKCVSRAQVRCLIPLATRSNRRYNHDRYHW